jgi:hypothetical protein
VASGVERRVSILASESGKTRKAVSVCYLCVYALRLSSMQLRAFTVFMPVVDVARRALVGISRPPFLTGGAGKYAPKTIPDAG